MSFKTNEKKKNMGIQNETSLGFGELRISMSNVRLLTTFLSSDLPKEKIAFKHQLNYENIFQ